MLFGNPELRATPESGEWIKAIILTHGTVRPDTLSWGRWDLTLGQEHRSFASAKGLVVYDENANYEQLKTAGLIFLCGCYISDETLAAVQTLVKEGATAVTSARFAPPCAGIPGEGAAAETADGTGRWLSPRIWLRRGQAPCRHQERPMRSVTVCAAAKRCACAFHRTATLRRC